MKESREIRLKLRKFLFSGGYRSTLEKANNNEELKNLVLKLDAEILEGFLRDEIETKNTNVHEYFLDLMNSVTDEEIYERDYIDRQISLYLSKDAQEDFYKCNSISEALENLKRYKDNIWQDVRNDAESIVFIEKINKTFVDNIDRIVLINDIFYNILERAFSIEDI